MIEYFSQQVTSSSSASQSEPSLQVSAIRSDWVSMDRSLYLPSSRS